VEQIECHGIACHGVPPKSVDSLKVVGRPLSATFPATLPTYGRYAKSCVWLGFSRVYTSGLEPDSSYPPGHSDIGAVGGFNHCKAILSDHFRSLLGPFGVTPKSRRGLAASDPGEATRPLAAL
jgi:hypothetical protein